MDHERLLTGLTGDFARLREVTRDRLHERVPTCPQWTVYDLLDHVAMVYLHKVACLQTGKLPESWPPDWGDEPLPERLDRAFAALCVEFGTREPGEPTATWYEPDQTVGFWIRRMAHETVIHRVDGELATAAPVAPVPADLAEDGVDEVLRTFLAYGSAEDYPGSRPDRELPPVVVAAGERSWAVRLGPDGAVVTPGESEGAARVSGDPTGVLLWLWRRPGVVPVDPSGDTELLDRLQLMLRDATQ